jgi:hypothetical protein
MPPGAGFQLRGATERDEPGTFIAAIEASFAVRSALPTCASPPTLSRGRAEAQRNRVSLRTELSNGLPLVLGDRIQLQQVILNLITNAIQAMSGTDPAHQQGTPMPPRHQRGAVGATAFVMAGAARTGHDRRDWIALLDHLVGGCEERFRHRDAKQPGSLMVDYERGANAELKALARLGDVGGAVAAGQQPVVADAVTAVVLSKSVHHLSI